MQKTNSPDNAGHVFLFVVTWNSITLHQHREKTHVPCHFILHLQPASSRFNPVSFPQSDEGVLTSSYSRQIFSMGIPQPDKLLAQVTLVHRI